MNSTRSALFPNNRSGTMNARCACKTGRAEARGLFLRNAEDEQHTKRPSVDWTIVCNRILCRARRRRLRRFARARAAAVAGGRGVRTVPQLRGQHQHDADSARAHAAGTGGCGTTSSTWAGR